MPIAASRNAMSANVGEHPDLHRARRGLKIDDVGHRSHVGDRLLRIRLLDDAAHRRHQLRERRRGADDQLLRRVSPEPAVVHLFVRQVDLRLAAAFEPAHANVADDADDRPILPGKVELPAQGILSGPVALDEGFADDGDELCRHRVAVADIASPAHGNIQRGKKARRDEPHARRIVVASLELHAVDAHRPDAAAPDHRQAADIGGVGDAR